MEPPRPLGALRESLAILRARPVAIPLLGAAVILSIGAVCCGFGLIAGPWFACELTAIQIGVARQREVRRTRSWLSAAVLLVGSVALSAAVFWLTMVGLGVDLQSGLDVTDTWATGNDLSWPSFGFGAVGALLAQSFVLPFMYAPFLLIDRGGTIGAAAAESARLVVRGGAGAHFLTLGMATSLQASPLLAALVLILSIEDPGVVVVVILGALPAAAVAIPIGHGMIISQYARLTAESPPPEPASIGSSSSLRAPRSLQWVWAVLVVAPMLAAALAGASLVRPSRLGPGRAPDGEVVADVAPPERGNREVWLPGTALQVRIKRNRIDVIASDGGGAGRLPLGGRGKLERVRVVRVRDNWVIEATTARGTFRTTIDGAGVRLDDDLQARLADRVPLWGVIAILLAIAVGALVMGPSLAWLAELPRIADPADRARRIRRAWIGAAMLAPLALAALAAGTRAIVG